MSPHEQALFLGAQPKPIQNICCIGAGYVGGTISTVIAGENPHIAVHVVDKNQERIDAWKSKTFPTDEPGYYSYTRGTRSELTTSPNIFFSTNIIAAICKADIVMIAVDTPLKASDGESREALDMTNFHSAIEDIAEHSTSDKIVVVKSTVPCGTSQALSRRLADLCAADVVFDILCNPEFLAQGTAMSNLLCPDRILIGSEQTRRGYQAAATLRKVYSWVKNDRIIGMNLQSAELAKLTANAMLAQRVSDINAISALCEKTGADVEVIALACGLDTRIGPKMLKASLGFGGSCLGKDVATLAHLSDTHGMHQIGAYWRSINQINDFQTSRVIDIITQQMNLNSEDDRQIAVFGCTYKQDVNDVRSSPALSFVALLLYNNYKVRVYEPQVSSSTILEELAKIVKLKGYDLDELPIICESPYQACEGASAVVVATNCAEWYKPNELQRVETLPDLESIGMLYAICFQAQMESKRIDWAKIANLMKAPRLVVDGHNVINQEDLTQLGFRVHKIGKAVQYEQ